MNTSNSTDGARAMADLCLGVSMMLLLLHFYYYCLPVFYVHHLVPDLAIKIVRNIRQTGLFRSIYLSKLLALAFILLSLLARGGGKEGKIGKRRVLIVLGISAGLFFISSLVLPDWRATNQPFDRYVRAEIIYIICSIIGFVLLISGVSDLFQLLRSRMSGDDPFGEAQAGFPQDEELRQTKFSINLPAHYIYRGRKRKSWINIVNPRRGVMIVGSPGCGKSWFVIEPCIEQLMKKGMAMFVYDLKYDTLTKLVYTLFLEHRRKYPAKAAFYSINLSDLSRSHRCNVIMPGTLEWTSDALGVSRNLLYSLNRTWVHRQGEFFVESPVNFLGALIWFLRKYKGGIFCTLPHVIELAQVEYGALFSVLSLEPEISSLIGPFILAYKDEAMEMLDSQMSSVKIPLGRLTSPNLYYILTGNDCSLDINNPKAPKVLCLGGDPARSEALTPIMSLYIDRLARLVNQPGKYPCALVCDEFASVRAYSITDVVATARSNEIVPILAVQDVSQLRVQYSREEADTLMNIAGNLFCGQVGGETAEHISRRFPKVLQEKTSVSTSSRDTAVGQSQEWTETVSPALIGSLSSGEFVGVIADDPDERVKLKAFHASFRNGGVDVLDYEALPVVRKVSAEEIDAVFQQVKADIRDLVSAELVRMAGDPELSGKMMH